MLAFEAVLHGALRGVGEFDRSGNDSAHAEVSGRATAGESLGFAWDKVLRMRRELLLRREWRVVPVGTGNSGSTG